MNSANSNFCGKNNYLYYFMCKRRIERQTMMSGMKIDCQYIGVCQPTVTEPWSDDGIMLYDLIGLAYQNS